MFDIITSRGTDGTQFIAIEEYIPETFVYGGNGTQGNLLDGNGNQVYATYAGKRNISWTIMPANSVFKFVNLASTPATYELDGNGDVLNDIDGVPVLSTDFSAEQVNVVITSSSYTFICNRDEIGVIATNVADDLDAFTLSNGLLSSLYKA
ncbi:hypothetical protein CJD36_003665 [Flavipsychrobacter stenotrophus]|uniref:Uncharacterized protein n=1 Tax=Flavipsychrobacter stenotrophus TaxID=2077091 RepID=A0A2S7T0Y0_9BACT|nr:hypothetical protein [Flavipsychrobacter stenotrophus]PQJ12852.1 hypothetical protein CJD36_003665 [Flavipsychrobacter stenotrophus]